MEYALIFTWKRAIVGREAKALEVFADSRMFWGKLAAEGLVKEPMVFMRPDLNMMIVPGHREKLFEIIGRDDFLMLLDKATFIAEDLNYEIFATAETVDHFLELYATAGKELAFL